MNLLRICFENSIQPAPIIGATIAAIVVVAGWFFVPKLKRKNEIKKELRGYRLELLRSLIELKKNIKEKDFQFDRELYSEVLKKLEYFGRRDEIKNSEKIKGKIKALEKIMEDFENKCIKPTLEKDSERIDYWKNEVEEKVIIVDDNTGVEKKMIVEDFEEIKTGLIKEEEERWKKKKGKIFNDFEKGIINELMELFDSMRNRIRKEIGQKE